MVCRDSPASPSSHRSTEGYKLLSLGYHRPELQQENICICSVPAQAAFSETSFILCAMMPLQGGSTDRAVPFTQVKARAKKQEYGEKEQFPFPPFSLCPLSGPIADTQCAQDAARHRCECKGINAKTQSLQMPDAGCITSNEIRIVSFIYWRWKQSFVRQRKNEKTLNNEGSAPKFRQLLHLKQAEVSSFHISTNGTAT